MKEIKLNNKIKNKKYLFVIILILIISLITFFIKFSKNDNKNFKIGNNLNNKTLQEIEKYILNISSYDAKITVEVESNKNKTKYILRQIYLYPNIEKQIVEEPSNIKGLEIIYNKNQLTINNSRLQLSKIYKNYNYLVDNFLWLNSFIEDYKKEKNNLKNSKIYEKNNEIIMEVNMKKNNNILRKKLIIDKKNGKILKMIVQDKNKKNLVYILYNEIKINRTKKEDIIL